MDFFNSLAAARTIYVLGIVNLASGLLIFFTCRCLPGSRIGSRFMSYGPYKLLFRNHCYIWLVFWLSVIVHAVFALKFYGWPG
jgi:hypothetical protein